ncbi:unnamed protein product [Ectocarpus fasciculatus]
MAVSVRHATLTLHKREQWYEDIRPSVGGSDFNPLAASANFCAFVDQHGFGAVVMPLAAVGKGRPQPMPAVRVGAEIRGLEWDPFCPNNLATGGGDGMVKVWSIPPEGLKEDLVAPLVSINTATGDDGISDAQAVPKGLAFHPCAPGLIASRGLRKISLCDLTRPQAPCLSVGGSEAFDGDTYDMQWSYSGDVVLTTDASRALQLLDLRAGNVVAKAQDVHGPGTSRVTWCDNSVYMLTTGMSKLTREREFAVWDARSMSAPVSRTRVGGTSSGFLLPRLQYGLGLVTLCGRGDSTVRMLSFDYATGKAVAVSTTSVGGVARAYAFVPRASCDVMSCEVTRLLKLCDDGVQPVSIVIPRRDKKRFHEELFPPAPGGRPSLTAPDWLAGMNVPPYLEVLPPPQPAPRVELNHAPSSSSTAPAAATPHSAPPSAPTPPTTQEKQQAAAQPSPANASGEPAVVLNPASEGLAAPTASGTGAGAGAEATTTTTERPPNGEDQPAVASSPRAGDPAAPGDRPTAAGEEESVPDAAAAPVLESAASSGPNWRGGAPKIKLRHVYGVETKGAKPVFNLSPLLTSLDGPILAASSSFWAVPWVGGGGPVYVSPLSASGKVEPDCGLVNGHKAMVHSIAFSPFQPNLMATGSEDSTVKLWSLPEGGLAEGNMGADDAIADLTFNYTAVRYVEFNPVSENVVMTTNSDHSVQLCDVAAGGDTAASTIDVHPNTINSACFNGDGSLIATTCRDGKIRVLDPRAGSVVAEGQGHQGRKTMKAAWCFGAGRREVLASTGCAAAGHRQLCLWDPRDLSSPYSTKTVDSSNGLLLPMFCEATGLLLLAGRGGSGIKYYELSDSGGTSPPSAQFCHEYKAEGDPLSGLALLPPQCLDVASVEVARLLRLTSTSVEPVSLMLPRSADMKGFFQDGIYRSVRSSSPCLTSAEWLGGGTPSVSEGGGLRSLRPEGMLPLSERPLPSDVAVPKAVIFRQQMEQREQEEKHAADTMAKMTTLANQNAEYNPNLSVAMGVDQATIVDSGSEGEWSD